MNGIEKTKKYFMRHFILTTVAVAGFLSAIVTLFVDINTQISIKFLIFAIFVALIVIIMLIGLISEIVLDNDSANSIEKLKLKYLNRKTERGEVFQNLSNIKFNYGDVVKIYYLDDENIEQFIGIGIISHIQSDNRICHIKFLVNDKSFENKKDVFFSLKLNKDELLKLFNNDNKE